MPEHVIIVKTPDGDIIGAVYPDDRLNPQFTVEQIERFPDLDCSIFSLTSLSQFEDHVLGEGYA